MTGVLLEASSRPRLLYYAMYDPSGQDSAPKVRVRLLGQALERCAAVTWLNGPRGRRARQGLAWLRSAGMGSVDAIYVESATSAATPFDVAFLAWARLRGRPVGVYFRDAYQLYRDEYPRVRRRQILADLAWRVTLPLLRRLATTRFTPSEGLGTALRLRSPVLLPPGTDPSAPDLGAGLEPIVAYVGAMSASDGFDRLLAAMALVRAGVPDARLLAIGPPPRESLPAWVDVRQAGRDGLPELLRPARVCVIPRPITAYTDFAVPLKLMDYLALGKPIVATAAAETRRLLDRADAGLLVGDSPPELAAGLTRVVMEQGLAEALAAGARRLALSPDTTWDARAATMLAALAGPWVRGA